MFWRNPMAAVAVILRDTEGRVLLVRRKGTRSGSWCIPCGHTEWEKEIRTAALGWFPPHDPPRPLAFPTDERVLAGLARGDRQIIIPARGGEVQ